MRGARDDFFSDCMPVALAWFEKAILRKFEGKCKGRLGSDGDELRVLNRVIRRTAHGYEWEADQRHAEILARELGLTADSKPVCTPGRMLGQKEIEEAEAKERERDEASDTRYRALIARANFLSVDMSDIS